MRIKSAEFVISVADSAKLPHFGAPEIAFAGKSNSGKSSFINFLTGNGKLARTSSEPGRTRLINYFSVNGGELMFVDLPGYGFARAPKSEQAKWGRLAEGYLEGSENLKNVFIATVEGFPELDDIIPQIEAAKLKKLYVTPLMLVAGDHATNDMAGDDDSWKNILESKGFEVECTVKGLGEYDEVCDLYLEHLSKLLKRQ